MFLLLAGTACGPGRGEVRDWKPEDHDQDQGVVGRQVAASSARAEPGTVDPGLIELAWGQKCASCHGSVGRGDGPSGPMVSAPDLTRDEFLSRVTDEEIVKVIREGRGRMPAAELPPNVVQGIVARIRAKGRPR